MKNQMNDLTRLTFSDSCSYDSFNNYLVTTDREQNVLFGDFEASAEHGFEIGLISVLPEAGHFSSAGHLNTQNHICSSQPGKGELRNLRAKHRSQVI